MNSGDLIKPELLNSFLFSDELLPISMTTHEVKCFLERTKEYSWLPLCTPKNEPEIDDEILHELVISFPYQPGTRFYVQEDFALQYSPEPDLIHCFYRDQQVCKISKAYLSNSLINCITKLENELSWNHSSFMEQSISRLFGKILNIEEPLHLDLVSSHGVMEEWELGFQGIIPILKQQCCFHFLTDESTSQVCCGKYLQEQSWDAGFIQHWIDRFGTEILNCYTLKVRLARLYINTDSAVQYIYATPFYEGFNEPA